VIRPCDLPSLKISKFQALPKNAKPISTWDNEDEAFLDVVKQLKRLITGESGAVPAGTPGMDAPPAAAPDNLSAIKECKELVAKGKVDKAIKKIMPICQQTDEDIYNQVLMLSGRNEALKKEMMMGLISGDNAKRTQAQITYALLQTLDDLEDEL